MAKGSRGGKRAATEGYLGSGIPREGFPNPQRNAGWEMSEGTRFLKNNIEGFYQDYEADINNIYAYHSEMVADLLRFGYDNAHIKAIMGDGSYSQDKMYTLRTAYGEGASKAVIDYIKKQDLSERTWLYVDDALQGKASLQQIKKVIQKHET